MATSTRRPRRSSEAARICARSSSSSTTSTRHAAIVAADELLDGPDQRVAVLDRLGQPLLDVVGEAGAVVGVEHRQHEHRDVRGLRVDAFNASTVSQPSIVGMMQVEHDDRRLLRGRLEPHGFGTRARRDRRGSRGSASSTRPTSSNDGSSSQTSTSGPSAVGATRTGQVSSAGSVNENVAPWPGVALGPDPPAVLLDEAAADGQAEAGAALLAGVRRVDLLEALEDRLQLVGRDATTLVGDAEQDVAAVRAPPTA